MSVLIKDMEMPINCDSCRIMVLEDTNCDQELFCGCPLVFKAYPQGEDHRPEYCPLVQLPTHGRLIDADALIEDLKRQCKEVFRIDAVSPEDFWINRNEAYRQRLYESWCEGFYEYVGSRPTIIPAEEGE